MRRSARGVVGGLDRAITGSPSPIAASVFGVKAIIAVPEGANPGKVESMRNLGANVVFHGAVFDDALGYAERLAK